jgi:EAL domain-containing protein (putative c-di-GMP-specific phosphodiesterase class I)/GGDEF domain-containing protein
MGCSAVQAARHCLPPVWITFDDPLNEAARLDALRRLALLDTPPSEAFDRITRMAARLFRLPVAAVSLTDSDRQWFKSRVGVGHWSIPRLKAPCASVTETSAVLVVNDLQQDAYFKNSHLASGGVRFYAGAPLTTRDGYCLGAMCVLGMEPREATEEEIGALSDLAAMVMAQIELQHALGRVDPMSGLPNRNQFMDDFADLELEHARGTPGLAVMVNLAKAEQISNALRVMGQGYLDTMVAEAARAFRAQVCASQKIYHVSLTQFIMIAPLDAGQAGFRQRLQHWLDNRSAWSSSRFVTTPALGFAPFAVGETEGLDLLRTAQSAAHDAFASSSKLSVYSPSQDAAWQRRFMLLNEFGRALEDPGQLRLVYQPRVDIASGRCLGVEALLRWTHPRYGAISPGEFMPIVEQTSMAHPATAWVLDGALAQLAAWHAAGLDIEMSVNVCAPNLQEASFAQEVLDALARHRVAPQRLEIELTESAMMENLAHARRTLDTLHAAGVRLAIDDFGTGYSSMSYLENMPADVVKIDQAFVRDVETDARKCALAEGMVALLRGLGFRVVAEGVETEAARAIMARAGCAEAQGYLFARPLESEALAAWCRLAAAIPA